MTLDATRLRSLLHYDPETGIFTRLVGLRGVRAGETAGSPHKGGYLYIGIDRRKYRAHRLAWLYMTGELPPEIDHENRIRHDNRWSNLRVANRSQNNANGKRRSDNTSGQKGVNWVARANSWRAYIAKDGRQIHLGYFKDFEAAVIARNRAFKSQFGEFANL